MLLHGLVDLRRTERERRAVKELRRIDHDLGRRDDLGAAPIEDVLERLHRVELRLRYGMQHQRNDLIEIRIEHAGLVEPPQRHRAVGRIVDERQRRDRRKLDLAVDVVEEGPGDLHHIRLDAIIGVEDVDDAHPFADIEMDDALARLVDARRPGQEESVIDRVVGLVAGGEDEIRLFGLSRSGCQHRQAQQPCGQPLHRHIPSP